MGKTLFDKIWDSHVITDLGNGFVLLHIDRLLLHDMSGGKALKEAIEKGYPPIQPRLTYGTPDHTMSTKPGRDEFTHPPGLPLIKSMRETTSAYGIKLFDLGARRPGHRARHGPRTRADAARHDAGLRRQPHLHAWRTGLAGLRHRLLRTGACDRHADDGPAQAQAHARQLRGQDPAGRHGQGHDPSPDRRTRHRRRHRLLGRVCRLGRARLAGRGAAHAVQPHHRDGRAHRHGGARRHDLRISQRPRLCAEGRDVGPRRRALAHPADRSRRRVRSRAHDRHEERGAADHLGHQPRACHRRRPRHPRSEQGPRGEARRLGSRAELPGARARQADRGHQGRLGVHRLLHQLPHLRPARRRRRS